MRLRRWLFDQGDNLAGGIYGTILVTSVVAAADSSDAIWQSLGIVEVTVIVFWLAHVYAACARVVARQQRAVLAPWAAADRAEGMAAAAGGRRSHDRAPRRRASG